MFVYRPVAFDDPRFPDGRGVLLAWSLEVGKGPAGNDRALYLFRSAGSFFICGSVPERSGLIGFLEIEHGLARRTYYRFEKRLLPFPDDLIDLVSDEEVGPDWLKRSSTSPWVAR